MESRHEYTEREAAENARDERFERLRQREERFLPQPNVVYCSQCGGEFIRYLDWTGYSHCKNHAGLENHDDKE